MGGPVGRQLTVSRCQPGESPEVALQSGVGQLLIGAELVRLLLRHRPGQGQLTTQPEPETADLVRRLPDHVLKLVRLVRVGHGAECITTPRRPVPPNG